MRPIAPIAIFMGLGGCAAQGAPSFILFGAYFPAWMLCAVIGIAGALAARIGMVTTGLSDTLPFQLFVCTAIGLIVAISAWLLWFGR
jgi:hypothetical protein